MLPTSTSVSYTSNTNKVSIKGVVVPLSDCTSWLSSAVRSRAYDEEFEDIVFNEIMKVEGFDNSELLAAFAEPDLQLEVHDIGETIAELALETEFNAIWPTNRRRDLRSARANMQGCDVVGLIPLPNGNYQFIFSEVKTSSDKSIPPAVMYGNKGLSYQISNLVIDGALLRRLITYLFSRVMDNPTHLEKFKNAVSNLGANFPNGSKIVGVLVRDTKPNAGDVTKHAKDLSELLPDNNNLSLIAVYVEMPATEWQQHCNPL